MELIEEWKDIEGYNGLYQISNLGKIKSFRKSSKCKSNNGYIINPGVDNNGYLVCVLNNNGNRKTYKIHRLVALAFIPNPNNYSDVNHKDENKSNNRIDNLEWMSHKNNMNYGTLKERIRTYHKTKHVLQYSLDGQLIKEWISISEPAKLLKISVGNIINCCKRRCKTVGGYKWSYT